MLCDDGGLKKLHTGVEQGNVCGLQAKFGISFFLRLLDYASPSNLMQQQLQIP